MDRWWLWRRLAIIQSIKIPKALLGDFYGVLIKRLIRTEYRLPNHPQVFRSRCARRSGCGDRCTVAVVIGHATAAAATAAAEHLHLIGDDFGGIYPRPIGRSICACADGLRCRLASLFQVFTGDFGKRLKKTTRCHSVISFARRVFVFVAVGGSDGNVGDGVVVRCNVLRGRVPDCQRE